MWVFDVDLSHHLILMSIQVFQEYAEQTMGHFPEDGHANTTLTIMYPVALQNPMVFRSTMTVTRASWLQSRNLPERNDLPFLLHRQRALSRLRKSVINGRLPDDYTILAVLQLVFAEV